MFEQGLVSLMSWVQPSSISLMMHGRDLVSMPPMPQVTEHPLHGDHLKGSSAENYDHIKRRFYFNLHDLEVIVNNYYSKIKILGFPCFC